MKKKLIEVALPLEAINVASAREKSIRHGHPSTLHLWWARRPLAACRAVLFASLVDDPSSLPEEFPTEAAQDAERQRLFRIIEELVVWENSNEPRVLEAARREILKSTGGNPPPVLDPFCGGGSIPLEAQRLGLEAHGSDLNPVAVLITKALIEIPPKFAGQPPVNPEAQRGLGKQGAWPGATGLAGDVRYYGKWMRDEAEKRIGHLYPKVKVWTHRSTGEMFTEQEYRETLGQTTTLLPDDSSLLPHAADLEPHELTVIAWIWARTVKCPNPACGCQMPLVRSFALSTKPGKQAWIEPIVDMPNKPVRFTVRAMATLHDLGKDSREFQKAIMQEGTVGKRGAICLCCNTPVPLDHVRSEGKAKRMGAQMLAIVAEGTRGRIYLPPTAEQESIASQAAPEWQPNTELVSNSRHMTPTVYGMTTHAELFTSRQLVALSMYSELVREARQLASGDAEAVGLTHDRASAYSNAIATYLAFTVSRLADLNNNLCQWRSDPAKQHVGHLFSRQAIPMVWDYAEANPVGPSAGGWDKTFIFVPKVLDSMSAGVVEGTANSAEAAASVANAGGFVFSTDPPYYDNVPYADLADFFYVWLRRSLANGYPDLFSTVLTPKSQELVADQFRHGGKEESRRFFEDGMKCVFGSISKSAHPDYPITVYYAFKQSDAEGDGVSDLAYVAPMLVPSGEASAVPMSTPNGTGKTKAVLEFASRLLSSTGWETMLQGLIDSGLQITGTWPMRTELGNRMRGLGSNALASSIVLVCRPRPDVATVATRREFVNALRTELEEALIKMMHGNIAPVDLAQATIGPGMAVYSRYKQVVETDGTPLRVRAALQIINQELDTVLASTEGDYDGDTRFCLAWFEQYGHDSAPFGDADVMARAKNTSVAGIESAGVLEAKAGKVRLLKRDEYPADWNPKADTRVPIWECTQQLVRELRERGEGAAARLSAALGSASESARDLAYRLYSICERKGWAQEALAYNSLVIAWPEISRMAANPNIALPHTTLTLGGLE